MAFVSLSEKRDSPKATFSTRGQREYTRTFFVEMDATTDDPLAIKDVAGLPRVGQFYQTTGGTDLAAVCNRVSCNPIDETRKRWIVDCHFTTDNNNEQQDPGQELDTDPFNWRPTVSVGFAQFTRVKQRGIFVQAENENDAQAPSSLDPKIGTETAIMNSAFTPFVDPPVEVDDSRLTLNIERIMGTVDLDEAATVMNTINSDTFTFKWNNIELSAAAQTVKLNDIRIREDNYGTTWFWRVSYEFHINADTWNVELLDHGMMNRSTDSNPDLQAGEANLIVITDREGGDVPEPVLLDGVGHPLGSANGTLGNAIFLEYQIYDELDWSTYNILKNLPYNRRK